jgi:aminoglycoside phosphotransferase family enzyme/predicted kinase
MNRPSSGSPGPETGLPDALLAPRAWPRSTGPVELVETHISWVFLTGELAYKVKKPVRLDFLDFSTPELRRHFCEEELRINRRFAPGLYLGLSKIVRTPDGLAVDRPGEVIEHAVRMRRFDRTQELDALLARGPVEASLLHEFGIKLALQQRAAPVAGPDLDWARPERTLRACCENFATLRQLDGEELLRRIRQLENWTEQSYRDVEPTLRKRLAAGRFRECHGDLHCGNVVRHGAELWAFDALEFDPGLRWIDVASDLAFLYMDLCARRHAELASALLDGWLTESGDFGALEVLRFYETYRACVRAKVAAIRLRQGSADSAGITQDLERYMVAAELAARPRQPRLVVTTGLSGSGKSWLAGRLLSPLAAIRVRSDVERKRLAAMSAGAASEGSIYSDEMTRRTYARLAELAALGLRAGFSVIVDSACLLAGERAAFRRLAASEGVPYRLLSVTADPTVLRARIQERSSRGGDPSEATVAVLERQRGFAEALTGEELAEAVCVDTTVEVDSNEIACALRGSGCGLAAGCQS